MTRILLADPNLQIRLLLKALIEAHPDWHVCAEVADGQDALDKIAELKPDLVILDFSMPRLNGLQVAAQLAKTSPALPVILCTIHSFPEMITEANKVGIRNVVSKSEAVDRLIGVIEAVLKGQGATTGAAQIELPGPKDTPGEKLPPETN